jgi:hypothetical protein
MNVFHSSSVIDVYTEWAINSTPIKIQISQLRFNQIDWFLISGKILFKMFFHAVTINKYFYESLLLTTLEKFYLLSSKKNTCEAFHR